MLSLSWLMPSMHLNSNYNLQNRRNEVLLYGLLKIAQQYIKADLFRLRGETFHWIAGHKCYRTSAASVMLHGWSGRDSNYSSLAAARVGPFQLSLIFRQPGQPCCTQQSPAQGAADRKEPSPFHHGGGPFCRYVPQMWQCSAATHTHIHTNLTGPSWLHSCNSS